MRKLIYILIYLLSTCALSTEVVFGVGDSNRADVNGHNFYTVGVHHEDYKYALSYWEEYTKSPWWDTNPEWRDSKPRTVIPQHITLEVTREIYTYSFSEDFEFFIDLGIMYTSQKSVALSSNFVFKEHIGLRYKSLILIRSHGSNADLKGENNGEDGIFFGGVILRF